jgi:hypothetical protein
MTAKSAYVIPLRVKMLEYVTVLFSEVTWKVMIGGKVPMRNCFVQPVFPHFSHFQSGIVTGLHASTIASDADCLGRLGTIGNSTIDSRRLSLYSQFEHEMLFAVLKRKSLSKKGLLSQRNSRSSCESPIPSPAGIRDVLTTE